MKHLFFAFLFLPFCAHAQDAVNDSLFTVISHTKEDTTKANAYIKLSSRKATSDSAMAVNYALTALQLSDKAGFKVGRAKALYVLSDLYDKHYDFQASLRYCKEGISWSAQNGLKQLLAKGYQNYGLTLKHHSDNKGALVYYDSALTIYTQLNDSAGIERVYNNMGNAHANIGNNDESIKYLLKALNMAQLRRNYEGEFKAYANLSVVYSKNANHKLALDNSLKSLEPVKKLGDSSLLMSAYQTIGASYINLQDPAKALPYIQTAYAYAKRKGDLTGMALNICNIQPALNNLGRFKEAADVGAEAVTISRQIGDDLSLGFALRHLAESHIELKNYRSAEKELDEARKIANDLEETQLKLNVLTWYTNMYQETGNYKKALESLVEFTNIKDSVFGVEKNKALTELQVKYESEKKEAELAKSKVAIAQSELELHRKNSQLMMYWMLAAALGVVAIVIFRNARMERKRLKKENELKLELAASEADNKMQNEKLRISRELHDNIGSQLTFINSSLETMRHNGNEADTLEDTQKLALNTIRELRSTVWLINQKEFLLDDFIIKLREFLKPVASSGTSVSVNLNGSGNHKLDANTATNIFRIIQEAVNNALKYSGCTELIITADSTEAGKLRIVIEDNGTGFDMATGKRGYGLKNIKARAEAIKGACTIKSEPGRGTTVSLSFMRIYSIRLSAHLYAKL